MKPLSEASKTTPSPQDQLLRFLLLALVLVMFFTSLELMGDSFKLMGGGLAESLLKMTSNPFVGLFIGILATSLVQSSSTTTTLTVSLVAAGALDIAGAIPIVMGANIGTSVTNTIVSLGSVTRKEEFRRAMAGATVQDFFNFLAVAVLFPLELMFQVVSTPAAYFTESLTNLGGTQLLSPVKQITEPIAGFLIAATGESGILVLLAGLGLLFLSLRFLVKLLKSLVLGRSERMLHDYIFGHPVVSMLFGVGLTFLVQSSSITTSLTVPLVGAGILTVTQIYPFVLGANVGTTMTAILAALVLSSSGAPGSVEALQGIAAVKVALAHLFFNVYGIALFLPIDQLRRIPIRLAEKLGDWAVTNRAYAIGYIAAVFFAIPLLTILSTRNLEMSYDPPKPERLEQMAPASAPTSEVEAERLTPVKG
ncbi:phosphate transporter [Longibacter salinarum]|uniref:Phosphate transporter n=1 Tax=Longibacter salinarum TaxID=1850348 RepID=A0A2A8CUP7_9BACT|nr:Na/Pi symporter [Longibacter salinarum]PEN11483.1 phosphate transporter [Longibacter salinarum]